MTSVWHYTPGSRLGALVAAGVIEPSADGIAAGETPAVWFTADTADAPATQTTWRTPDGAVRTLTPDEATRVANGLIRVAVNGDRVTTTWDDHKQQGGLDPALAADLERRVAEWGATPSDWRASYQGVTADEWLSIECWSEGAWHPVTEVQVGEELYVLDAPAPGSD